MHHMLSHMTLKSILGLQELFQTLFFIFFFRSYTGVMCFFRFVKI